MTTRGQRAKKQLAATNSSAPAKIKESDYNKILEANVDLDAYLAAEFIDDTQTDKAKGVLAAYLKELFPNAKTPKEMKAEVDKVDDAVKGFYWLTLDRGTLKGTHLSKSGALSSLTKADFEADRKTVEGNLEKVSTIANNLMGGSWPVNLDLDYPFVLDENLLKQVYNDVVVPKVAILFNGDRSTQEKTTIITRLGNYYGLQRYPIDQREQQPKTIPTGNGKNQKTDEEVVEKNLFRFALFTPQNINKFVFTPTDKNKEAIGYAFGVEKYGGKPFGAEKSIFRREQFPKHIAQAIVPFVEKVSSSLTDDEKINLGVSKFLKEFNSSMSQTQEDPKTAAAAAPQDVAPPAAQDPAAAAPTPADVPAAAPPTEDVPAAAPPAVTEDVAKKAADALAATDVIVQPAEPSDTKCDAVADAAAKAQQQTEALLKSIEDYDKQTVELSGILLRKDKVIEDLLVLKSQASALQGSNQRIELDLNACRSEKAALEAKIKALEDEIAKLQTRIANFEREQGTAGALAEKILQQIEIYEAKIDEIFDLKEKITLQLAEFEGTDDDKYKKLEALGIRLDARAQQIETSIKTLTKDCAAAEEQGDDASKKCEEERKKLESKLQEAERLKEEFNKKVTDEEKLKGELAKCGDRAAQLTKAFDAFCKSQSAAFERLNGKLGEVSLKFASSIASLTTIVEAQRNKVAEHEQRVQAVEAQAAAQPSQ